MYLRRQRPTRKVFIHQPSENHLEAGAAPVQHGPVSKAKLSEIKVQLLQGEPAMARADGQTRFGTFYELEVRGREPGTEARQFLNVLDQVEAADALGYDSTWFADHHFTRGFSHCSAPETILAALSQRTKQIRLGHAWCCFPSSTRSASPPASRRWTS
jgi:hypothetical protein